MRDKPPFWRLRPFAFAAGLFALSGFLASQVVIGGTFFDFWLGAASLVSGLAAIVTFIAHIIEAT